MGEAQSQPNHLNGNPNGFYPQATQQMGEPRWESKAVAINNLIYVIGGGTAREFSNCWANLANTIDVFDAQTEQFVKSIPLPTTAKRRIGPGAAAIKKDMIST